MRKSKILITMKPESEDEDPKLIFTVATEEQIGKLLRRRDVAQIVLVEQECLAFSTPRVDVVHLIAIDSLAIKDVLAMEEIEEED